VQHAVACACAHQAEDTVNDFVGGDVEQCGRRGCACPRRALVGDDFVVIVSRVGEGALAVDVAGCPDAGHAGAQLAVDLNITLVIGGHTGGIQPQVIGVGSSAQ
jgi:hypothetical protein